MNDLQSIISELNEEEQRLFVKHLQQKNKRSDTKNVQLFKHYASGPIQSEVLAKALYGKDNRPALHALRKRVYESLIDFIASRNLQEESSEETQIRKEVLAGQYFLKHKQYTTGFKTLLKAEKKALDHDLYGLLNEIYHLLIEHAHLSTLAPLDQLVFRAQENQKRFQQEERLNMVYASVRNTLSQVIYEAKVIPFQELTQDLFQLYGISQEAALNYRSLFKLAEIANIAAFVTKDYYSIEPFILQNYQKIQEQEVDMQKQRYYHIHVLYIIANIYFRNKNFEQAEAFLDKMHAEMLQQKQKYFKVFLPKHTCLKALNLNYKGKGAEAIELIEGSNTHKSKDVETSLDIQLSLIVFYFQQQDFKKAHRLFTNLYHTDSWFEEKAGIEWVIKKNLIEILLHIELGNIDYVESRMKSFERKYYGFLREIDENRVITFLGLVKKYYQAPEMAASQKFEDEVERSFTWMSPQREDIFVMSFYAWLKSKMKRADLYKTTLDLVQL